MSDVPRKLTDEEWNELLAAAQAEEAQRHERIRAMRGHEGPSRLDTFRVGFGKASEVVEPSGYTAKALLQKLTDKKPRDLPEDIEAMIRDALNDIKNNNPESIVFSFRIPNMWNATHMVFVPINEEQSFKVNPIDEDGQVADTEFVF